MSQRGMTLQRRYQYRPVVPRPHNNANAINRPCPDLVAPPPYAYPDLSIDGTADRDFRNSEVGKNEKTGEPPGRDSNS